MEPQADVQSRARRALVQKLESLERAGVTHVPKGRRKAAAAAPTVVAATTVPAVSAPASSPPLPETTPLCGQATAPATRGNDTLELIRADVAACTRCAELACTRTQTVFGVGNPDARLCFMGEAPGADEDQQGEPFVGKAGQLLNKIIEACTLRREDVYILNVLKCRPPGNRAPLPDEAANCREYRDRQLALIKPEYICCLGASAAQALLETDQTIGRLRGKFHDYRGITVMCTYHPAYLLRNPAAKRDVWDDMKTLMAKMGVKL